MLPPLNYLAACLPIPSCLAVYRTVLQTAKEKLGIAPQEGVGEGAARKAGEVAAAPLPAVGQGGLSHTQK